MYIWGQRRIKASLGVMTEAGNLGSFQNVIRQAGRENVGLFLIAGDLFHRQPLLKELKEVNALFASIPNTKIVLIAGNHDYIKENSFYKKDFMGKKRFLAF